jgi:hypothetical protein
VWGRLAVGAPWARAGGGPSWASGGGDTRMGEREREGLGPESAQPGGGREEFFLFFFFFYFYFYFYFSFSIISFSFKQIFI